MDRRRKKKDQRQIEIVLFIHIIPEFNFDQSINMKMNLIINFRLRKNIDITICFLLANKINRSHARITIEPPCQLDWMIQKLGKIFNKCKVLWLVAFNS